MILDCMIAFVAAGALYFIMQRLKSWLYKAASGGGNVRLSTVLSVHGAAPELEYRVKSLENLRESGRIDGDIILRDCGMDPETAAIAEKLAETGRVKLIN